MLRLCYSVTQSEQRPRLLKEKKKSKTKPRFHVCVKNSEAEQGNVVGSFLL